MFTRRATRWTIGLCVAATWTLGSGSPAWAWAWPADGSVLRGYSVGADKYAAGQHRGIDIALGDAQAVRAPASGEVSFAGPVPTHGLTVTIVTTDGYRASLTHLGTLRVRKGATVAEGDPIAEPGPSGEAEHDVPYLHLGTRVGEDEYVDPLGLLPPRSAPSPPPAPAAPPAPAPLPESSPPPAAEQPAAPPAAPAPEPDLPPPAAEAPAPSLGEPEPAAETPTVTQPGATPTLVPAGTPHGSTRGAQGAAQHSARTVGGSAAAANSPSRPRLRSAAPGAEAPRTNVPSIGAGTRPTTAEPIVGHHATPSLGPVDPAEGQVAVLTGVSHRLDRWTVMRTLESLLLRSAMLLALIVGGVVLYARRVARVPLPIIGARERAGESEEDPCGRRVAICERPSAHRACRRLRRPVGHIRPLPPAPRERRAHGQRDGRAWNSSHGRSRRGGRVAA